MKHDFNEPRGEGCTCQEDGEPIRGPEAGWSLTHSGPRKDQRTAQVGDDRLRAGGGSLKASGCPRPVDRHLALCDLDQPRRTGNNSKTLVDSFGFFRKSTLEIRLTL